MARYKVALLAIVGLAVFSLAVLRYWQGRRPGLGGPGFDMVEVCKWKYANDGIPNTCEARCKESYKGGGLTQAGEGDTTWLYCCPIGYTNCPASNGERVCKTGASCG